MKRNLKHILLTFLVVIGFTAIAFFLIFDRIEPIGWDDKIILSQEVKTQYDIGSIWSEEFDHILECCPINIEYRFTFAHGDSIGILIEIVSEYEDYFDIPFLDQTYGRKGEASMVSTEIYQKRGACFVQMANNKDDQLEVGPPAFEFYSDIGCDLLPNDWPVRSYMLANTYGSIVLKRFQ
ncbi:MAG TPA: hypothetical protein DHV30_05965 [Balneola sp.]|nr:hypothetical protein [Balneola sp.]